MTEKSDKQNQSHWALTVLTSFTALLNMMVPIVLVRVLTKEDIGLYKIFFLYLMVGPWKSFGGSIYNGLYFWMGGSKEALQLVRQAWTILMCWTLVLVVPAFLFSEEIARLAGYEYRFTLLFIICASINLTSQCYENVSVADGRVMRGAVFSAGFQLLRMMAFISTVFIFRKLDVIFISYAVVTAGEVILGTILGYKQGYYRIIWQPKLIKEILKYSLPLVVGFTISAIATSADQIILSKYLTHADFAVYAVGCLAIPPLIILESSVTRVVIPKIAKVLGDDKFEDARHLYHNAVRDISLLTVPVVVGMIFFAEPIILILFSEKYVDSIPILRLFALSYLIHVMPYDVVPRAQGNSIWIMQASIFFTVTALGFAFLGAKYGGPTGALIGILINETLRRFYSLAYLMKHMGWALLHCLPLEDIIKFMILALIPASLSLLAKGWFSNVMVWGIVSGVFCWIFYLGLIFPHKIKSIPSLIRSYISR